MIKKKKKKKKLIQINKLTYSKNAKSKKFTTNYYICAVAVLQMLLPSDYLKEGHSLGRLLAQCPCYVIALRCTLGAVHSPGMQFQFPGVCKQYKPAMSEASYFELESTTGASQTRKFL